MFEYSICTGTLNLRSNFQKRLFRDKVEEKVFLKTRGGEQLTQPYFYGAVPITIQTSDADRQEILREFPAPRLVSGSETFDIEQAQAGHRLNNARFLYIDHSVERTKTDKPYLKIRFSNNVCTINTKMWDNDGSVATSIPLLEEYAVFEIAGKVEEYQGFKSVTIDQLMPVTRQVNPFSLIPATQQSLEDFIVELYCYVQETEEPYRTLMLSAMKRFWNDFSVRPAAKGHHHAYLGGLLKHTVGLMRLARYIVKSTNPYKGILELIAVIEREYKNELRKDYMSDNPGGNVRNLVWRDAIDHVYNHFYSMVKYKEEIPNASRLICSIFYHDLGKLLEYHHAGKGYDDFRFLFPTADLSALEERKPTGISMDPIGMYVGHIPYGTMLLAKMLETEHISLPIADVHQLMHNILCHHDKLEWGACVTPATMEGHLIHIVDFLDSRYERTEEIK